MHIEHIIPNKNDNLGNLCLSCSSCNLSKGTAITATDPQTDKAVSLYNPRKQQWHEHFQWINRGLIIEGKTDVGRATISRLKMNQQRLLRARRNWILAGNHPPKLDRNN